MYSPACLAATDSMLRMLFFFVVARILISERSRPIGSPFNAHEISIGKSPLRMAHTTEIESPQLAGSSVITNGAICGATATQHFLSLCYPSICLFLSLFSRRERDPHPLPRRDHLARRSERSDEKDRKKEGRYTRVRLFRKGIENVNVCLSSVALSVPFTVNSAE